MKIVLDSNYNINNIIDSDNIEVIKIKKINELNNIDDLDIIFISKIENKNDYKVLLKYLKKLKNKVLIINDNNKYLRRIFLRNLDIYRYGNNIYDDIEYIKNKENIIFKYDNNKYTINTLNEEILGYIIIGLLFGEDINEVINILEKTN